MKLLIVSALLTFVFVVVACAPRLAVESGTQASGAVSSDEETVMNIPTWTTNSGCSSCHTSEVASTTDSSALCSIHTPQGLVCTTCHVDTDGKLTVVHADYATGKQPIKLSKTTVSSDVCTSCHNVEDLKVKTTSVTLLADLNGTTVNPHDLPATENHVSSITCASCHEVHSVKLLDETASKRCLSCHHTGVYECGTCHPLE